MTNRILCISWAFSIEKDSELPHTAPGRSCCIKLHVLCDDDRGKDKHSSDPHRRCSASGQEETGIRLIRSLSREK